MEMKRGFATSMRSNSEMKRGFATSMRSNSRFVSGHARCITTSFHFNSISHLATNPNPIPIKPKSYISYSPNPAHARLQQLLPQKSKVGFDKLDDALAVFDKMLLMKPLPNVIDFNQLLAALVKMKQYSTAVSLFRDMRVSRIPVDIVTFNTVINCCCHLNRLDCAFSLLAGIIKHGFVPNVVTYTTLIRGLISQDKPTDAQILFQNLVRFKLIQPNVVTYNTIINGICKRGHISTAVKLFGFMKKKGHAEKQAVISPFDICTSYNSKSLMGATMLPARNIGNYIDTEYPATQTRQILRPGMVLLTNYISLHVQVNIINRCRELGLGPGGFHQPGYQGGAKLRLQMMCLGKRWDPETKYEEIFQSDVPETLGIPDEFVLLVKKALADAHLLIKKNEVLEGVEEMLPGMSPDVCIVNFYTTNGKLGLHQDRDESKDSLLRGLPVVSFSVGDSAEFLYGDKRDIRKAESILLKSGDVLIFGGQSRHIYHGVTSINPNTAPPALLKETNLSPGRLNLTFRQF